MDETVAGRPGQRLTTEGRFPSFRWAPSGHWLAYVKDDGFWVIRSSGTDARALSPSAGMVRLLRVHFLERLL